MNELKEPASLRSAHGNSQMIALGYLAFALALQSLHASHGSTPGLLRDGDPLCHGALGALATNAVHNDGSDFQLLSTLARDLSRYLQALPPARWKPENVAWPPRMTTVHFQDRRDPVFGPVSLQLSLEGDPNLEPTPNPQAHEEPLPAIVPFTEILWSIASRFVEPHLFLQIQQLNSLIPKGTTGSAKISEPPRNNNVHFNWGAEATRVPSKQTTAFLIPWAELLRKKVRRHLATRGPIAIEINLAHDSIDFVVETEAGALSVEILFCTSSPRPLPATPSSPHAKNDIARAQTLPCGVLVRWDDYQNEPSLSMRFHLHDILNDMWMTHFSTTFLRSHNVQESTADSPIIGGSKNAMPDQLESLKIAAYPFDPSRQARGTLWQLNVRQSSHGTDDLAIIEGNVPMYQLPSRIKVTTTATDALKSSDQSRDGGYFELLWLFAQRPLSPMEARFNHNAPQHLYFREVSVGKGGETFYSPWRQGSFDLRPQAQQVTIRLTRDPRSEPM